MISRIKPIPSGFHTLTPHLVVKGASKAIEFYKKAFGAEEICRTHWPDSESIMQADLKIGDSHVFARSPSAGAGSFAKSADIELSVAGCKFPHYECEAQFD